MRFTKTTAGEVREMKGVRVEILAPTTSGSLWKGILCWHAGGVSRQLMETPDYDALNRKVYESTIAGGRGLWAYTLDHYKSIRPHIRRVRKLARIRGLKTRTICATITPVDDTQGILRREK